jgi:hypothetical protein
MRITICTVLLALAAALPSGAAAQWRPAPHVFPSASPAAPTEPAAPPPKRWAVQGERERGGAMLVGGLWGGLVGGLAGVGVGLAADDMEMAYFGTAGGIAAGMSMGVHHGNLKAGSLPLGMLASVGWSLALAAFAVDANSVPVLAVAPLGSLLISMTVEERTSRER